MTQAVARSITVICPGCEARVRVPFAINPATERDEDGTVVLAVDVDYRPIREHALVHHD